MHDKLFYGDLVVKVLMLGLLVLVKVHLEVIPELFADFLLLENADVLDNHGFHWRWIHVPIVFMVLLFLLLMMHLLLFVATLWLYLRMFFLF